MTEFDFLQSLPSIIFILAFSVIFILFLFGGFVLLTTGIDSQRMERGRRMLLNSLYALFITLLVVFVFFLVTYLLKGGEALKPSQDTGEFPPSPLTSFPLPPQFIKIGDYYFSTPISLGTLEKGDISVNPEFHALYAILCKNNEEYDPSSLAKGEGYDIIYIGTSVEGSLEYECWLESCNQRAENLYLTIFLTSSDPREIKDELNFQVNPPCPLAE